VRYLAGYVTNWCNKSPEHGKTDDMNR
jgi:hypothetical protein